MNEQMETHLEVMAHLWNRLSQCYGESFTREYGKVGESAYQYWTEKLFGYSAKSLGRGLKFCIESGDTFPPNLPTFKQRCYQPEEQKDAVMPLGLESTGDFVKHLTHDQTGKRRILSQVAESEVAKIKKIIGE